MKKKKIEAINLKDVWISVGGNTPWKEFPSKGVIESIELHENDPRNFEGADSDLIVINFSDGYTMEVKAIEYMILRKY